VPNPNLLQGLPAHLRMFEPTRAAALQRLGTIDPRQYARSRNTLDGAVTGLSPYFTHGLLSMKEAGRAIHARHPLGFEDKLVFEFAWREFFHHVWQHAADHGNAILQDMHGSLPWPGIYATSVPDDIRQGRTGVPAIDSAVRTLYATGYLHNHARMWLASYVVHLRKVHWRAGADWLYGHLLDGDLPSNHLSWQWVAATFSGKPYLFNADNVLRYAPAAAQAAWASPSTVIDTSYEALEDLARRQGDVGPERGAHVGVTEPELTGFLPDDTHPSEAAGQGHVHGGKPGLFKALRHSLRGPLAIKLIADTENTTNRPIELVHPWALSPRGSNGNGDAFRLGVIHLPAHALWPWSARRWGFMLQAMADVTDAVWAGDLTMLDLSASADVTAQATLFPGYREALAAVATLTPAPQLLPGPTILCHSFSKFYSRVRRDVVTFADLL
jgi:deoxyribodipyrimidine photo-lyase